MSGLESLLIKARSFTKRGDAEAARALYHEVLGRHPRNARAIAALKALDEPGDTPAQIAFDRMVAAFNAGRMIEAAACGQALSDKHPHAHGVHNLLGAALLELDSHAEAEAAFCRAIAADPHGDAGYNNLAIALRRQGRMDEAEAVYRDVIARAPGYADAPYNLANLLEQAERLDEAAQWLETAAACDPGHVEAHYNLGNLRARQGYRDEAIACFAAAATLKSDHTDAHNNMGAQLLAAQRADDAIAAFDRALVANPRNVQAMVNRGKALVLKGERPAAIAAFRGALALDPQDKSARLQALFEEAHLCDWHARHEYALTQGPDAAAVQPFASLPFLDDPAHQLRRSQACAARMFPDVSPSLPDPAPSPDGRIRIGYFSADFHDHATMHLMAGFFRTHDRARFEVRLYSYGPRRETDAARIALRQQADAFTEIGPMRDKDLVALARTDALDIAVDLKGYTLGTRTRLFGQRLAPVQVSWMGYPGTSGHPAIDYFIADHVTVPAGAEAFFSEKVVRLAHCYQANDDARTIAADTRGRAGWGLPAKGFVFASFNQSYKISPAEWGIWMDLLRGAEGSVLWLLDTGADTRRNLCREAQMRGIAPARLIFAPPIPHAEHLGRLAHADLFLDTFAVNAHTTASDALWAGLPVLTLAGRQFAARVAASLVQAAGLPELAVESKAAYAAAALTLANDADRLGNLRARLAENLKSHPLFDTAGYTRRVEAAFSEMHRRRLAGLAPEHFDVE
ncbi:tetratricopeptide repeat protein [Novosphingobium sp. P6W]|uniref:O-linked N-acetylglucosamine transferase, SPINDLY family protein n=1 Tax=Novosphingobium sp. P6W TaxID=1609758 RepID=UPI00069604CD|nr:tetratricopeptide repeat protein [Novosphingobium sp. P6W]AXB75624.1 tetratricopeptide repeat protein [Novosphingobium sp. P6W]